MAFRLLKRSVQSVRCFAVAYVYIMYQKYLQSKNEN